MFQPITNELKLIQRPSRCPTQLLLQQRFSAAVLKLSSIKDLHNKMKGWVTQSELRRTGLYTMWTSTPEFF